MLKLIPTLTAILVSIQFLFAGDIVEMDEASFDKFSNVQDGWLGADATISVVLPDGSTLWLFGDTFIGEKHNDFSIDKNGKIITSTFIHEDVNGNMKTYFNGTKEDPKSIIPNIGKDYFWPEHAIVEDDTIRIFTQRVTKKESDQVGFGFKVIGNYISSFTYPDFKFISHKDLEFNDSAKTRFGAHVLKEEDFTYIFGVRDTTIGGMSYPLPYLARAENSVMNQWEFYSGNESWSNKFSDAQPIGTRAMPESFYVHKHNGSYYLLMHEIWLVGKLYILKSDKITGPWHNAFMGGDEKVFCEIKEHKPNFTYNLFAHPQFDSEGKLLISFNTNTSKFEDIFKSSLNYRARFLWLDIDKAYEATSPELIEIFESPTVVTTIDSKKKALK
jgi:hypothetical protein